MKKVLTAIITAIFGICLVAATVATATAAPKLKKVANFKASATPVTVTLTWSKSSDAKGYEIQQKSGKKWKTVKKINKAKTTSFTVKKLKNGTTYQFRIRAVNGKKAGAYVTVKIKTGVESIKSFTGVSAGLKSVKLTWAKANVNGYTIQQKVGKKWKTVKTIKKAGTTSVTITGLPAAKASSFRIRGFAKGSLRTYDGAFTKAINVTTAVTPMKSVAVKSVTYNSATIGWAKLSGVSGYQVQKVQAGKWVNVNTAVKNSVTQLTVGGLTSCAQQRIRVRAYQKDAGKTYYNAWVELKPTTKIGNVTGFAGPTYPDYSTVKMTWKAAPGAKTYRVYNNNAVLFDVASTYANIKIEPNKTYKIAVAPVNGKTVGTKTAVITFTTPCAQVTGVEVTGITDTSVGLSWNAVAGAQSYRVEYSTNGTAWTSVISTKNSATVEYLEKDTEYQFRVSAANKNGTKVQYGEVSGTLVKATPAGVTAVSGSALPTIDWEDIEGASSYTVEYYAINKDVWYAAKENITETKYEITEAATRYYRVKGLDADGDAVYVSDGITVAGSGRTFTTDTYGVSFSWPVTVNATAYKIVVTSQNQTINNKVLSASVNSYSLVLAPESFYEIEVYAVVSNNKNTVVDQFAVTTGKLNVNDNTDDGINAKLLYLAESINRTKYDNSVVTEVTANSASSNKMTYMKFDAGSVFNGMMVVPLLGAFKGLEKGVDYAIGDNGIECYNEKAVSALLNFIDGSGSSNNVVEISNVKAIYNDPDSGYSYGVGDITVTNKDGKVTKKVGYLSDAVQPAGKRAYIYNPSGLASNWKNGFESVTMTKIAEGYEIKVVIKPETANTETGKKAEYHAGLVNSIGNTNVSFGGDDEDTKMVTDIGKTTVVARIDKGGKLLSYDVSTSYKMDMDSSMTISVSEGENAEGSSLTFDMAMDLIGADTYKSTFKCYSK